jgi:hypothetical protein
MSTYQAGRPHVGGQVHPESGFSTQSMVPRGLDRFASYRNAPDTPSCRAKRVCEEVGSVLLALNNIHSPG